MAVRSKRLGVGTLAPSGITLYTVPGGETALVKWVTLHNRGPAADSMRLGINPAGALGTHITFVANLGVDQVVNLEVWWVLQPGDELQGLSTLPFVDYMVFGAELEGVAD